MQPPKGTLLTDLLTWIRGFDMCPYCLRGFTFKQWRERDRDTGGHDPCPGSTDS